MVDADPEDTGIHARVKRLSEGYRQLASDVSAIDGKVDSLTSDVADVRETAARSEGKLDGLARQLETVTVIHTEHAVADIRVAGVRAATAIEDATDRRKSRRTFFTQLLVTALGSGGIGAAAHWLVGC